MAEIAQDPPQSSAGEAPWESEVDEGQPRMDGVQHEIATETWVEESAVADETAYPSQAEPSEETGDDPSGQREMPPCFLEYSGSKYLLFPSTAAAASADLTSSSSSNLVSHQVLFPGSTQEQEEIFECELTVLFNELKSVFQIGLDNSSNLGTNETEQQQRPQEAEYLKSGADPGTEWPDQTVSSSSAASEEVELIIELPRLGISFSEFSAHNKTFNLNRLYTLHKALHLFQSGSQLPSDTGLDDADPATHPALELKLVIAPNPFSTRVKYLTQVLETVDPGNKWIPRNMIPTVSPALRPQETLAAGSSQNAPEDYELEVEEQDDSQVAFESQEVETMENQILTNGEQKEVAVDGVDEGTDDIYEGENWQEKGTTDSDLNGIEAEAQEFDYDDTGPSTEVHEHVGEDVGVFVEAEEPGEQPAVSESTEVLAEVSKELEDLANSNSQFLQEPVEGIPADNLGYVGNSEGDRDFDDMDDYAEANTTVEAEDASQGNWEDVQVTDTLSSSVEGTMEGDDILNEVGTQEAFLDENGISGMDEFGSIAATVAGTDDFGQYNDFEGGEGEGEAVQYYYDGSDHVVDGEVVGLEGENSMEETAIGEGYISQEEGFEDEYDVAINNQDKDGDQAVCEGEAVAGENGDELVERHSLAGDKRKTPENGLDEVLAGNGEESGFEEFEYYEGAEEVLLPSTEMAEGSMAKKVRIEG